MALEKNLLGVSQFFTADGTTEGIVTVLDASGFYAKQVVSIKSNAVAQQTFQVKRVNSPTQIMVGALDSYMDRGLDVSMYLFADGSVIKAAEQPKQKMMPGDIIQAVYEKDPAVAIRTKMVDTFGRDYNNGNPLPVSFSASFPNIVKITDGGGSGNNVAVNPDGSINVVVESGTGLTRKAVTTFGSVTTVLGSVLTTIVSYTVPFAKSSYLVRAECSGTNIAQYEVYVSSVIQARQRTWFGQFNSTFDFSSPTPESGIKYPAGTVIQLKVIHSRPFTGDFDGRIEVVEEG